MKAPVPAPQVNHRSSVVAQHKKQQPFFPKRKGDRISIGSINDASEIEADKLAEKVIRSPYEKQNPIKLSALIQKTHPSVLRDEIKIKNTDDPNVELFSIIHKALYSGYQPLDLHTKSIMEGQFGADFSNVKIHDNAQAYQSASALKAQAFTYDDHIVFGAGKYQPQTNRGKHLLAHELAHILQQRNGIKVLQKKPESIVDIPKVAEKFGAIPELPAILQKHKDAYPGDKSLQVLSDKLLNISNNNPDHLWEEVKKLAEATVIPSQEKQLDLLLDVYKKLEKFTEARELIKTKKYIQQKTAFNSTVFYKEVLKDDLNWLLQQEVLKDFFPFRLVDTFRMYLFGPLLQVQSINKIEVLKKRRADVVSNINTASGLIDNERLLVSLEAFLDLAASLSLIISKAEENLSKSNSRLDIKIRLASQLSDKKTLEQLELLLPEEEAFLLKAAAPQIQKVAAEASTFWSEAQKNIDILSKNTFALQSLLLSFKQHKKEFTPYEGLIEKTALSYLRLTEGGAIPGKQPFERQSKKALQDWKDIINKASFELIRVERSGKDKEGTLSNLYGIFILFLYRAYNFLLPLPDQSDAEAYENYQKLERIAFGQAIKNIGTLLDSDKLLTLGTEVLRPTGKAIAGGAQKETFLAFGMNTHWEFNSLSPQQTLKKFSEENVKVNESSYLAMLMQYFFRIALMKEEIKKLKSYLQAANPNMNDIDPESYVPIPNLVFKSLSEESASENSVIPRRFVLKDVYFSVPEKQRDVFDNNVRASKPFQKALASKFTKNEATFMAIEPDIHYEAGGIVVWVISNWEGFIQTMKQLFPNAVLPSSVQGIDTTWFSEFVKVILKEEAKLKGKPAGKGSFLDLLQTTSQQELEKAKAALKPLRRKALSYHRRVLIKLVIRPLWDAFQDNVRGISTWENPQKAMDQMISMAGGHPFLLDEDQNEELKLQIAATLLEIGPLIYKRLFDQDFGAHTSRIDLVSTLLPHILGALSLESEVLKNKDTLLLEYPLDQHQQRVESLKKTRDGMLSLLQEAYENEWLEGDALATELRDRNSNIPFTKTTPIIYEGKTYVLTNVYKSFRYQPSVNLNTGGVKWSEQMIENANPSKLFISNGATEQRVDKRDRKGMKLFTIETVSNKEGKHEVMDITDLNDDKLKEIDAIIATRSNIKNLETLGEVLEAGAEWIKTPFYFIPGLGQAVLAGDIVVGVLQFLTSPEFEFLKRMLSGDGIELIKDSFGRVTHLFTVEGFWDTLLNDQINLPKISEPKEKEVNEETSKKTDGRLKKFFLKLKRFGIKVLNGLGRLKSLINFNIKKLRFFLLKRPTLDAIISFIVKNFQKIKGVAEFIFDKADGDNEKENHKDFLDEVQNMLNRLKELQVPQNLIPLDLIIDMIVRIAMKALKGPKGIIAGSVKTLLEKAGIYQKVLDLVAEHLQGSWIDPNQVLNEIITDQIQPMVQEAGNAMAEGIEDVLKKVPGLEALGLPKAPKITAIEDTGESFEQEEEEPKEAQPFPINPSEINNTHLLPEKATGGFALNKKQLNELSENYGQDFSHVRIHMDDESHKAVEAVGAEALTTGSHIYLRSGLTPHEQPVSPIIKHELAHVIQQTGPRSIPKHYSDNPIDGKPGKGVVMDTRKEAEANQFAKSGSENKTPDVTYNSGDTEGIYPKLTDVALRFFHSISEEPDQKIKRFGLKDLSSKAVLTQQETQLVQNLMTTISTHIPNTTFDKKFNEAKPEIIPYLQNKDKEWAKNQSVFSEMVRISKVKKKAAAEDTDPANWTLKMNHLEIALEEFILTETGIVLDIRLKQQAGTIDITRFEVKNLFLEHVSDNDIWNKIITNTFSRASKSPNVRTTYKTSENQTYQEAAKTVITTLEIKRIFSNQGFKFTDVLAEQIEEQVHSDPDKVHTGDERDPIPIRWTKTGHQDPLHLEPALEKWAIRKREPLDLSEKVAYMKSKTRLEVPPLQVQAKSFPNAKKETINDKEYYFVEIGIDERFMYRIDKKIPRPQQPDSRGGIINIFKTLLESYNYNWDSPTQHSPDHVQDIGLGGKDVLNNLWPLESKALNEREANTVYNQEVRYKEGQEVKKGRVNDLYGKWFIIKSIGRTV